MPANKPFIAPAITEFIDRINEPGASPAEKQLTQNTRLLEPVIETMQGEELQNVAIMEISFGQARLLEFLTRQLSRQSESGLKAIDIGTFTGHSAGAIARGMLRGGIVYTCDKEPKTAEMDFRKIAADFWTKEGVADRIIPKTAPAIETLHALLENERGSFDLVFIDADKLGYNDYYEAALSLLRPGGLVVLDNMLWSGKVAYPAEDRDDTRALRSLNEKISRDDRVDHILLEVEDGIMIAEKRLTPNPLKSGSRDAAE